MCFLAKNTATGFIYELFFVFLSSQGDEAKKKQQPFDT